MSAKRPLDSSIYLAACHSFLQIMDMLHLAKLLAMRQLLRGCLVPRGTGVRILQPPSDLLSQQLNLLDNSG